MAATIGVGQMFLVSPTCGHPRNARQQAMRWTDLFTALMAAAWGYLFVAGVNGLLGIKAQHVPGYPAIGQMVLYTGLPTLVLLLLASTVVLARKARWFHDAYPFAVGLSVFALFPVVMFWSGGV